MAFKKSEMIKRVKSELISPFSMVDMSLISFYLSLKVEQNREKRTIELSQPAYINKILSKFYFDKAYVVNIPMKESTILKQKTDKDVSPSEKEQYQGMTSSLIFLIVEIRPDIIFATSVISHFVNNSGH